MKYLDLIGLSEVWANIKSYISSKIPTKTSQLQNDSNYATTSQLPSKTSQLINDSDFTTNAKLATKQGTISDLATIRSGASKGATAVQPSELASKANDSAVVHKTGDETIKGNKYFDGNFVDVTGYRFRVKGTNQEVGVIPTDGNKWNGFIFCDKNNKQTFAIENGHLANGNTVLNFGLTRNLTDSTLFNYESVKFFKDGKNCEKGLNCDVYPNVNNKYVLGTSTNKWKDVYANTFNGKLVGNADTATKATKDASGNVITDTYATKKELGSKANNSDVVHKSGYETISGVKNFNNVVLGEQDGVIRIGNNGEGALFCNLYYDGGIYNNIKLFYPKTDNEYNLGTPTHKWKDVNTNLLNGKTPAYADDLALKANIADTVLKTNTDYTFRNYSLNSLNFDEKYNENYVVGISVDGYGTRPVGGWTNIINFCTYHFMTQLCIPIDVNKDTDCMYIRTRWANNTTWGEWRKSANDNSVVHKSGNETINGLKVFNDGANFSYVYASRISFSSEYYITTDTNDNSLRIIRDGTGHGNNYKVIIQGDTGKFFAPNGFIGNLQGNADTATSANDPNAVHKSGDETINGDKTFNNLIQARGRLTVQNTDSNRFTDINQGWIEISATDYPLIDFKHEGTQDYLGRIGILPDNILYLETKYGAPIIANGKNIVRSVNGVNADNNGNVSIQGFSNGIGEIIQGYYVPGGIVQKSGSVYFGTLVQPNPGTTLSDFRDINITITDEFHPEPGKVYDYSQIFSTLYLHSYDSEYAVGATFDCGSNPKVDKWFGGWVKVAGSNLVRNSGRYLCTSVSPYGYAVTLRYNLTMSCETHSYPGGSYPIYGCKIISKTVPQNQMTVTSKATFMRVG